MRAPSGGNDVWKGLEAISWFETQLAPFLLLSHPSSSSVTKQKSDKAEKRLVSLLHGQRGMGRSSERFLWEKIFFMPLSQSTVANRQNFSTASFPLPPFLRCPSWFGTLPRAAPILWVRWTLINPGWILKIRIERKKSEQCESTCNHRSVL